MQVVLKSIAQTIETYLLPKLNDLVASGMEYPDAESKIATDCKLSAKTVEALRDAYDAEQQ